MTDRGQVRIADTGVHLYTHNRASDLPKLVADALGRGERWSDPECLARVIFDEMTGLSGTATGFGIGADHHSDVWRLVDVSTSSQEVAIHDKMRGGHVTVSGPYPFEEFVEVFATDG